MKEYTCFRKPNKLETINIFNILFKLEVGKANEGKWDHKEHWLTI